MSKIDRGTSPEEIAALVSQALQSAGISATLSGGGAVTLYSENEYESHDLDFVTSERLSVIAVAIRPLGFERTPGARQFEHPRSELYVEFPSGPLAFGETVVPDEDACTIRTPFGPLRIVTPTQCVMDRLAASVHWTDNPSFDQAIMVAKRQPIDWDALGDWATAEAIDPGVISRLRSLAEHD